MKIDAISMQPESVLSGKVNGQADGKGFADVLMDIVDGAVRTDAADKANSVALAAGSANDLAKILIDAEKADIALSLTIQIRNKIIDAYNEIMRMQV